jgi:hypothetical protein
MMRRLREGAAMKTSFAPIRKKGMAFKRAFAIQDLARQ